MDLKHIARLSRIRLEPSELEVFEVQVADILRYVEELKTVDVEGLEPTSHPLPLSNVFREDLPTASLTTESFLARAPRAKGAFFEVPRVIEEGG